MRKNDKYTDHNDSHNNRLNKLHKNITVTQITGTSSANNNSRSCNNKKLLKRRNRCWMMLNCRIGVCMQQNCSQSARRRGESSSVSSATGGHFNCYCCCRCCCRCCCCCFSNQPRPSTFAYIKCSATFFCLLLWFIKLLLVCFHHHRSSGYLPASSLYAHQSLFRRLILIK